MKIIIVGPAFPLRGGIANLNEALCRNLNKENHNCEIVSFKLQYPEFLFPGTTQYDRSSHSPSDITIKTWINSINPFNWLISAIRIKNLKPDLVLFRYWLPLLAPCLGTISRIIKSKKIKTIAIVDNLHPHEKRFGDKFLSKFFVKSMDGFIAMSNRVLQEIKVVQPEKPALFSPHPIYDIFGEKISKEEGRRKLGLEVEGKYILFFGFIRKYKGLDLMLQTMTDSRIREKEIKLLVAGEFYEDKTEYLNFIKNNQLEDQVLIHSHFIPKEAVKYYFSAADLVVQTYRSATQSGVTQIAFHFEKPMLVTNVGGLGEIIEHQKDGYVIDPDSKKIADAIDDFFTYNREKEFIEHVKMNKEKFSWKKLIDSIEKLYSLVKI